MRASVGSVYKPPPPWIQQRYAAHGSTLREPASNTAISARRETDAELHRSNTSGASFGASSPTREHVQRSNVRVVHSSAGSYPFFTYASNAIFGATERFDLSYKSLRSSCSIAAIFAIVLMPFVVALLMSDDNDRRLHDVERDVRSALIDMVMTNHTEDLWAEHVVVTQDGGSTSVDIPATFHSRLNSELAPLMRLHANEIWTKSDNPELKCHPPEEQIVSFSLSKSSRLPAECMFEDSNRNQSIRDIRDLRITFPTKSSRHMMRVQIAEDRQTPVNADDSPRRYSSWGRFRGRIFIDLSDTSKIALQRYCGESDADVDIEPLAASDVLLITVIELKRLHSLWTSGSAMTSRDSGENSHDSVFRAVITPLDLYPAHSSPIQAIRESLRKKMWSTKKETYGVPESAQTSSEKVESEPLHPAVDAAILPHATTNIAERFSDNNSAHTTSKSPEGTFNVNKRENYIEGSGDTAEDTTSQVDNDMPKSEEPEYDQNLREGQRSSASDLESDKPFSNVAGGNEEGVGDSASGLPADSGDPSLSSDSPVAQKLSTTHERTDNASPGLARAEHIDLSPAKPIPTLGSHSSHLVERGLGMSVPETSSASRERTASSMGQIANAEAQQGVPRVTDFRSSREGRADHFESVQSGSLFQESIARSTPQLVPKAARSMNSADVSSKQLQKAVESPVDPIPNQKRSKLSQQRLAHSTPQLVPKVARSMNTADTSGERLQGVVQYPANILRNREETKLVNSVPRIALVDQPPNVLEPQISSHLEVSDILKRQYNGIRRKRRRKRRRVHMPPAA